MHNNQVKTNKGLPIEFRDHGFLLDYVKDTHSRIVVRKCTQVGASFSTNIKMLHLGSQAPLTTIYCVDPKTEIMTDKGWRFYYDLKVGDNIITLNMSTGKSEWKPLNEIFVKEYSGKMISWEGRNISALSTPDHKWPVHNGNDKFFFKQTQELNQEHLYIPKSVEYNNQQKIKYDNDFVRLFAWIYTEGYYPKSKSTGKLNRSVTRIVIVQSFIHNKKYCNELEALFDRMKIDYRYDVMKNGCRSYVIKGTIPLKIRSMFPNKKPTAEFIRLLTAEQLNIFIDTSINADGWTDKHKTRAFIQKDKDIIDVFSLACVLAGYSISVQKQNSKDDCYVVKIIKYKNVHVNQIGRAGKKQTVNYNGVVWCPSTDNGTFLAKRNHTVYWTGNTLPTSSEAKNFVLTKFDPMVERSPGLLDMVTKVVLRERVLYNSVVKRIGPSYYFFRGCVDEQTEVLTCRGWQTRSTIKTGEKLPTINMDTGYLDIQKVNSISEYDVDEELVKISGKNTDMLLTKDHRCLLRSRRTGKLQIKRARNLKTESSDYIPFDTNGLCQLSSINISPEIFKIIGWVLSEGSYWTKHYNKQLLSGIKRYGYPKITVTQKKNYKELIENLDTAGIVYNIKKPNAGIGKIELGHVISRKIIDLFPNKKLTASILFKLNRLQLQALFDGLMLGDGSADGRKFYQSDKSFCDAFQVLVSLLGKASRVFEKKVYDNTYSKKTKFVVSVKDIKSSHRFKLKKEDYVGKVWCPSTNNGTIIIRRNGKVQLTGQSWTTWGAQSIDADVLVVDELDFQKPNVRQMWEERTEGSASLDIVYWIGYPSIPNYGIEELYESSDKRMWFIECGHCHKRQVLEFPDNVDMDKEIYICKFCKKELSDEMRRKGIWKITEPGRDIHGYWINKLMAPWIPASKIIGRFKKDTPKKFYNYTLGLPYVSKETELSDAVIQKTMIEEEELALIRAQEDVRVLIGIDQGDIFHMLVAIATPTMIVVVAAEQLRNEEGLKKRLEFYKPDMVVMDMFPNRHTAKKLCKEYGLNKFFMAKERNWTETSKARNYWNLNRATSEVGLERTESIDAMIEYIMKGAIKFRRTIPRLIHIDKKDPGVIQQLKNLVPDTQERHGRLRRVFKSVGPEHYGHALNFIVTAAHIVFPGWMSREALIPSSYLHNLKKKKPKPWYIKDFEERTRGLNPHDAIIIKPGGEIVEPEGDDWFPRAC